ncbi:MAG: family 16 glycosylhydrolase [Planctomycetota bacterium]
MTACRSALALLVFSLFFAAPAEAQPPELDGYTVSWYDEFDGNTLDTSKWVAGNTNQPTNNSIHDYIPGQVSVGNGVMTILTEDIPSRGWPFRSGLVSSTAGHRYGRFEVRAKLPATKGTWPAIWILPNTNSFPWPSEGEIDIMENRGDEPFKTSSAFHYGSNPPYVHNFVYSEQSTFDNGLVNYHDSFHVYACEWDPDQIRFFIDGVHYYTVYNSSVNQFLSGQSAPMHLIINTAVGGHFLENPDNTSVWPQRFEVDYVYVWEKDGDPDNRIDNGGFEQDNGSLSGWSVFNNTGPNVHVSDAYSHRGNSSAKIYGQFTGGTSYSGLEQSLSVTQGTEISANVRVFSPSNDSIGGTGNVAYFKIDYYSSPNGEFGSSDYMYSVSRVIANGATQSNQWTRHTIADTVPAGAVEARAVVVFEQPFNEGGAIYVDDIELQRRARNFLQVQPNGGAHTVEPFGG